MNSLYGKQVQKDNNHQFYIWSKQTLQNNFDDTIMDYHHLDSEMYVVQKKNDPGLDCKKENNKPKTKEVPIHLGSFILAHSKRLMNNIILSVDGFKENVIYYSDTDSIYISLALFNKLKEAGYFGGDLGQGKNDYNNGGIIFGLYLGPKVKYNLVLYDIGILTEKKTFKGYNKDSLKSEEFFKLSAGETITKDFKTSWKRSFEDGVNKNEFKKDDEGKRIKDENGEYEKNLQEKSFSANINELKRRRPNNNGDMLPYWLSKIYKPSEPVPLDDTYIEIPEEELEYLITDNPEIEEEEIEEEIEEIDIEENTD
jgi:hypothetical protein